VVPAYVSPCALAAIRGAPHHADVAPSDFSESALQRGRALLRAGHIAQAEGCFREALLTEPHAPELHATLGAIIAAQGRPADALPSFFSALKLRPDSADAHGNLGNALRELGRAHEAERHLREALRLRPAYPEAHGNLGRLLLAAGQAAEAAIHFDAALRVRPDDAPLLTCLAAAQRAVGRLREAESAARDALRVAPSLSEAHIELGNVLYELGCAAEARDAFRAALAISPRSALALLGLGVAGIALGAFDEAEAALRSALDQQPDLAEAHNARGDLLRNRGRLVDSEAALRQALRLRPDYPDAQVNLAFTLLQAGRFAEGWEAHEHRFRARAWRGHRVDFPAPRWNGEAIAGRKLLIHAEQGLGDAIQFCRYLPRIATDAELILRVPTPLTRLLALSFSDVQVIADTAPLPGFDLECPLLSLPQVLGEAPPAARYLAADPTQIASCRNWVERLPGRRVGLVWAGNPRLAADKRRSIALSTLVPLGALAGVTFVSLQHGPAASEQAPAGLIIHNPPHGLNDFADTAALVSTLDLVIGVDTAVIHLAGALGRPVWLLNRADTCWRWREQAGSSALYPSLREFRQDAPGDWSGVIAAVCEALAIESAIPRGA
jgi:Flp pilus assembly protein TadD